MDDNNKWPVERYSQWVKKSWVEIPLEKGNCVILIKDSQLLLINKDTVMETVCLAGGSGFVKSSYFNDNLGILVQNQGFISKFRIKFDTSPSESSVNNCLSCVSKLKNFIQVTDSASSNVTKPTEEESKVKTIHEMAMKLLQEDLESGSLDTNTPLPDGTLLEEMVRQCILDPGLPVFVGKIEKILKHLKGDTKK